MRYLLLSAAEKLHGKKKLARLLIVDGALLVIGAMHLIEYTDNGSVCSASMAIAYAVLFGAEWLDVAGA